MHRPCLVNLANMLETCSSSVLYCSVCYVWRCNEDLNDSQMFYLPLTRVIRYG